MEDCSEDGSGHECQEFVGKVTHCFVCEEMGPEYVTGLPNLFAKYGFWC